MLKREDVEIAETLDDIVKHVPDEALKAELLHWSKEYSVPEILAYAMLAWRRDLKTKDLYRILKMMEGR